MVQKAALRPVSVLRRKKMNSYRKNATIAGILFLTAIVTPLISMTFTRHIDVLICDGAKLDDTHGKIHYLIWNH